MVRTQAPSAQEGPVTDALHSWIQEHCTAGYRSLDLDPDREWGHGGCIRVMVGNLSVIPMAWLYQLTQCLPSQWICTWDTGIEVQEREEVG